MKSGKKNVWLYLSVATTNMEELHLLKDLKQGDKEAFSLLFRMYYKDLVLFGGTFLPDRLLCEDIVQSVFLKVWKDRGLLDIKTSLKSYLLKAVRNNCLDELRHREVRREHESYVLSTPGLEEVDTENYILYSDLSGHLQKALRKLPEACRIAFEMNRFEGLKYKEIAVRLQVSERTVEVRVGKALELLRIYLKEFFLFFLLYFLS